MLLAVSLAATDLKPKTVQAFDNYIRKVEARLDQEVKTPTFLWSDREEGRAAPANRGESFRHPWGIPVLH